MSPASTAVVPRFTVLTYLTTAIVAFTLWQQGWYLGAVLVLTLGGGVAIAQPVIEQRKLLMRGTPVLLMFSVMLASASGMVAVGNEVSDWIAPTKAPIVEPCVYAGIQEMDGRCEQCAAD